MIMIGKFLPILCSLIYSLFVYLCGSNRTVAQLGVVFVFWPLCNLKCSSFGCLHLVVSNFLLVRLK